MPRWVLVNTRTVASLFQALETLGHIQVDGETEFFQSIPCEGQRLFTELKIMILVFWAERYEVRIWVTFSLSQMMLQYRGTLGACTVSKSSTRFSLLPYPALSPMSPFGQGSPIECYSLKECCLWTCELGLLCDPNRRKQRQLTEPSWGLSRLPQNRKRSWRAGACKRQL